MTQSNDKKLEALAVQVELSDSAYDRAVDRYNDLGQHLGRKESLLHNLQPHVFPQGSFALGTAIKALNRGDNHDLDLSCNLESGVSRQTHTQRQLKTMLKHELEEYRKSRGIQDDLEEMHRCWRLKYQDKSGFHVDTVPGIPVDDTRRAELSKLMEQRITMDSALAADVARDSMWITDNRSQTYGVISQNWEASNPGGYLKWFQSRMAGLNERMAMDAKVTEVPVYRRKTTLQRSIQILKAHRDLMFAKLPDSKPISIIITTLAARAYQPTASMSQAMDAIINALDQFRASDADVVLNPANPAENFADKWNNPKYAKDRLKASFHQWVEQVTADIRDYLGAGTEQSLITEANRRFGVTPESGLLLAALSLSVPLQLPRYIVHRGSKSVGKARGRIVATDRSRTKGVYCQLPRDAPRAPGRWHVGL